MLINSESNFKNKSDSQNYENASNPEINVLSPDEEEVYSSS
jgi:hypothetical protein